jgi:hypothetical protein
MNERGEEIHLAIFNAEGLLLNEHAMEPLQKSYQPQKCCQFHMLDDQFGYLLIFWTRCGACAILESEKLQTSPTLIRKVWASLISRPRDHFVHQSTTLREEFICAGSGRLVNINIRFLAQGKRQCHNQLHTM